MNDGWKFGFALGSLRHLAAKEVREHRRKNATLVAYRYPMGVRLLRALLSGKSLISYLAAYFLLLLAALGTELLFEQLYISSNLFWANSSAVGSLLKDATSYLLAAQVTMVGLVFPIAVGLVTLIVQRESSSSSTAEVQIYYEETLAYRIGASSIALVIVLAIQVVWPAQLAIHQFSSGVHNLAFKVLLTVVHMGWLTLNLVALSHFLLTSLSFLRPGERGLMRKRYAANHSIPEDIFRRYLDVLHHGAENFFSPPFSGSDKNVPRVFFSSFWGDGVAEVTVRGSEKKVLVDIWLRPLRWVLRRWHERAVKAQSGSQRPLLVFVPHFQGSDPEGVVCRRVAGPPLTHLERKLVAISFRFGRSSK